MKSRGLGYETLTSIKTTYRPLRCGKAESAPFNALEPSHIL
jgi:hypothetical protein